MTEISAVVPIIIYNSFFEIFYNALYYYGSRVVQLNLTIQNFLYYFFLSW
jgi:hypothetical protein